MSWLSEFWKSALARMILGKIKALLVTIAGTVGRRLADVALEEVKRAEATGLPGKEKFKLVIENLRNTPEFSRLPQYVLEVAISAAVAIVDPKPNH